MFEETDFKLIKESVGKVACVCGNLDTATLMFGTKDQIINETRQIMEIGAPGGGFIMDNSIVMDECDPANMEVYFETVEKYGKY